MRKRSPLVRISVLSTARGVSAGAVVKLFGSREITLTPALASTRNCLLVVQCLTLRRRQFVAGPILCAVTTNRSPNFLAAYLGMCSPSHISLEKTELVIMLKVTYRGWQEGLLRRKATVLTSTRAEPALSSISIDCWPL